MTRTRRPSPPPASSALCALLLVVGCGPPPPLVDDTPIPVALTPGDGGLYAYGTVNGGDPFPLLIDTGTVLTSRAIPSGSAAKIIQGSVRLYGYDAQGAGAPRLELDQVQVLETPLATVGVGASTLDLSTGGILGGDLLQQFSLVLDYRGSTLTLLPGDLNCSCAVADGCRAVLPFTLAGGGTLSLGDSVLTYPPTRVTLDACLEPNSDPQSRGQGCITAPDGGTPAFNAAEYDVNGLPGVDTRLLVATGFGGLLLGASAWDLLHGQGSAAALLAGPTVELHFPGSATPVVAARATLGDDSSSVHRAAMALVGRFGLLGACGELARSRRLRAWSNIPVAMRGSFPPDCSAGTSDCPSEGAVSCLQCLNAGPNSICSDTHGNDRCNDRNQPAAAYVELAGPLDVFVVDDGAPILMEVNTDIQPALSVVGGVVGSELLSRLSARLDYPNSRILVSCAAAAGCTTYPAYACPDRDETSDCGPNGEQSEALCNAPSTIPPTSGPPDGGLPPLCLPAPIARDAGL